MNVTSIEAATAANQNLYDLVNAPGFGPHTTIRMITLMVNMDCTLLVNGDQVRVRSGIGFTLDSRVNIRSLEIVEAGVDVYAVIGF